MHKDAIYSNSYAQIWEKDKILLSDPGKTAISIKHLILSTFNIKKINSESLYAFKPFNMTT